MDREVYVNIRVLENAFQLGRPDDDLLVGTARGKPLAIPCIGDTVDSVLVPLEGLNQGSIGRVIYQHTRPGCYDQLAAVRLEGQVINAAHAQGSRFKFTRFPRKKSWDLV